MPILTNKAKCGVCAPNADKTLYHCADCATILNRQDLAERFPERHAAIVALIDARNAITKAYHARPENQVKHQKNIDAAKKAIEDVTLFAAGAQLTDGAL